MKLQLTDIEVTYGSRRNSHHAIKGLNLEVSRGKTLALVGESGSGKTTIAKVVAGLINPTRGTVAWLPDTSNNNAEEATNTPRPVQMVFQHPVQSLDPVWTIRRVVREPLTYRRDASTHSEVDLQALMSRVGLRPEVLDRYPHEISGGQAQRVAIARALIAEPEIVVLDEPTASLDQTVRARIQRLLAELQQQTGVGYLMVTHDMSSVQKLATHIAVMHRGRLVESGPANTILHKPLHPYTQALISAVPVADPRIKWSAQSTQLIERRAGQLDLRTRTCPVHHSSCSDHGPGLHDVDTDRKVACTNILPSAPKVV